MSLIVQIKKAVKGFSLDVNITVDGECLGILGASGCGKSMTLKCIAGIMTPDEGYIELNGRVLFDSKKKINLKPQERKVGYLFQNYALFPNMTVAQNIASGLKGREEEKQEKVKKMIASLHLQRLEKRHPDQLSGGQQQRVALARILVYEPEVMLFDEPFSALDYYLKEELQIQFAETLFSYKGDAILVTHSRDEAYQLAKRVAVLDGGRLLKTDNTRELFARPQKVKVARVTGCKNISKAKKISENTVYAEDWGWTFTVTGPILPSLSHIGIRAHDFRQVEKGEDPKNQIPCHVNKVSESPFEWNLLLQTEHNEKALVWWKIGKNQMGNRMEWKMPDALTVDPKDILLLED